MEIIILMSAYAGLLLAIKTLEVAKSAFGVDLAKSKSLPVP